LLLAVRHFVSVVIDVERVAAGARMRMVADIAEAVGWWPPEDSIYCVVLVQLVQPTFFSLDEALQQETDARCTITNVLVMRV
jgi:hypothetical protein